MMSVEEEYQEVKSIVDAGYRLVVYLWCFLNLSGVGKIHVLSPYDNPRRWLPFLSTILFGWPSLKDTLTLLSLYRCDLLNGCDLTEELYSHVVYQKLPIRDFDFRDAVEFDD